MLGKVGSFFSNIFKFHKKKIFALFFLTMVCTYFMFPFNDLSDLVTSKVSELTNGQVFVSFDTLDLSILPSPGLSLTNVFLETMALPALKAKSLTARPSLVGLLTFKPGISIDAEGFMGGDVSLSTRGGDKNPAGKIKQKINLDFGGVKLAEILNLLDLPVRISGVADGSATSVIDMDMADQPSADVQLNLNKVILDETDLNLQGMPLSIPRVALNDVAVEARLDKGVLEIGKLVVGKPGQDLSAQVSGHVAMNVSKQGPMLSVFPGNYEFYIRLQVGESFKQKMGPYLGILQSYLIGQNSYSIKLSGPNFYAVPSMTKGQ